MKQSNRHEHLVEKLKKVYNSRPLSKESLKRFMSEEITNHVYETNALEGSTLTFRETDLVINHGVTVDKKQIWEIDDAIGTKKAFEFILNTLNEQLTIKIIKTINGLIQFRYPTEAPFRTEHLRIRGSDVILANPLNVPILIDEYVVSHLETFSKYDLRSNPNQISDFIEDLALTHVTFERIHPFRDGNGRTGRLMINFESIKQGLLPVTISYENRKEYLDGLQQYDQSGDIEGLTLVMSKAVEKGLDNFIYLVYGDINDDSSIQ